MERLKQSIICLGLWIVAVIICYGMSNILFYYL